MKIGMIMNFFMKILYLSLKVVYSKNKVNVNKWGDSGDGQEGRDWENMLWKNRNQVFFKLRCKKLLDK